MTATTKSSPKKTSSEEELATADDLIHELEEGKTGCGPMARWPLLSVLAAAIVGIGIGVGLSFWEGDDEAKDKTIKWIGLVGDLFIRRCALAAAFVLQLGAWWTSRTFP